MDVVIWKVLGFMATMFGDPMKVIYIIEGVLANIFVYGVVVDLSQPDIHTLLMRF